MAEANADYFWRKAPSFQLQEILQNYFSRVMIRAQSNIVKHVRRQSNESKKEKIRAKADHKVFRC